MTCDVLPVVMFINRFLLYKLGIETPGPGPGSGVRVRAGGLEVGAQGAPRLIVKYELALSSSLIRPASLGGHADGNTGK